MSTNADLNASSKQNKGENGPPGTTEENKRSLPFRPKKDSVDLEVDGTNDSFSAPMDGDQDGSTQNPTSCSYSAGMSSYADQDASTQHAGGVSYCSDGTTEVNKHSLPSGSKEMADFWHARAVELCNTPIDSGSEPLPPTWNEEYDHYIVYLRHAPTVCPMFKTYERIYENITCVFPWLGRGFYKSFEAHLNKLSEETRDGKTMLPVIAKKKYWWSYQPTPRRNPRRATRDGLPDDNQA